MDCSKKTNDCREIYGFTLLELVIVLTIIAILGAIAVPVFSRYYEQICVKAAMMEIVQMVRDAKMMSLDGNDHAIHFNPAEGTVTLLSGKGPDGRWPTGDDVVVRSFKLRDKGGGLKFGHGSHGPIAGLRADPDGVTFNLSNNTAVFNEKLTGLCSGTVYIISSSGSAMAIVLDTREAGYDLYSWNGGEWVKY